MTHTNNIEKVAGAINVNGLHTGALKLDSPTAGRQGKEIATDQSSEESRSS